MGKDKLSEYELSRSPLVDFELVLEIKLGRYTMFWSAIGAFTMAS